MSSVYFLSVLAMSHDLLGLIYVLTHQPFVWSSVAMALVYQLERTTEASHVLDGKGPACAVYWDDYKGFSSVLSGDHSTALYMAAMSVEQGNPDRKFDTDVPQTTLDYLTIKAAAVLRRLDKDIQRIIDQGGADAIIYLTTLSTLRGALTETVTHRERLVGT